MKIFILSIILTISFVLSHNKMAAYLSHCFEINDYGGLTKYYLGGVCSRNVVIPNGVISIEQDAFWKKGLTSVTMPNSLISIGRHAFSDNNLASVIIPNRVTSIGALAFYNNRLTSVTIPNSVNFIGQGAFENNPLTSVCIRRPKGMISLGTNAFPASAKITYSCIF